MKWIKVTDKEPVFRKRYILLSDTENWMPGQLESVNETEAGKIFTFKDDEGKTLSEKITHYAVVSLPKA